MFGINEIYWDKGNYVKKIFSGIAPKYDLINNVISLGQAQKWRKKLVEVAKPPQDGRILDLCTGTGKVAELFLKEMKEGRVIGIDYCPEMLLKAKKRFNEKYKGRLEFRIGDVMELDLPDNSFDCVVIAFGLRNVENISQVLLEMKRVVKPGGKILSLDLAKPEKSYFSIVYYRYFYYLLPLIAGFIYGQKEPYQYFVESLKDYPHQAALKDKFIEIGFENVDYKELNGGIIAIHYGEK